jgi:hypothetical protein
VVELAEALDRGAGGSPATPIEAVRATAGLG